MKERSFSSTVFKTFLTKNNVNFHTNKNVSKFGAHLAHSEN